VRLVAGAVALVACAWLASPAARGRLVQAGDRRSATTLFAYAALFSLAYLRLDAGVGALVLFGAVQVTMLVGGWRAGSRPTPRSWWALVLSGAGLVLLAAPRAAGASELWAAVAMAGAGAAWGFYSLRGRHATAPLVETAGNFVRTTPAALVVLAAVFAAGAARITPRGFLLALVSGAITSGLGYAAWYAALPRLAPIQAGLVQLAVPVVAALGGIWLFDERLTPRLLGAGTLVVAGIALALVPLPRRGAAG
jgi:drug/metabolite transporter (DMT)-like permease